MGGGGGFGFSSVDKEILEEKAKKRISQVTRDKSKSVFISFSHEDIGLVNLLRGQKTSKDVDLKFNDHSVKKAYKSESEEYIRKKIREKIQKCSVTLVYLTENSIKSKWVKWEVEESVKMGKGVVGVYKDGEALNIPRSIGEKLSTKAKWNHKDIMEAINKASEER